MLFGNRRPRKSDARRRSHDIHRPRGEQLEDRTLLSVNLGGTAPPSNPLIATAPFGMDFAGRRPIEPGGRLERLRPRRRQRRRLRRLHDRRADRHQPRARWASASAPRLPRLRLQDGQFHDHHRLDRQDGVGDVPVHRQRPRGQPGAARPAARPRPIPITGHARSTSPSRASRSNSSAATSWRAWAPRSSSVKLASGNYGILIGAPNALDVNQANAGTGRAYLISGNFNNFIGQTINLDTPTDLHRADHRHVREQRHRRATSATRSRAGTTSSATASGTSSSGRPTRPTARPAAPARSMPCPPRCSPARPRRSTSRRSARAARNSAIFTGATSGAQAGWSVADGGDVNGVTSSGTNVDDLLIGAPSAAAAAYLIYGGSTLAGLAQTVNGHPLHQPGQRRGRVHHDRGRPGCHVRRPGRQHDRLGRQLGRRLQRRRLRRHPDRLAPVLLQLERDHQRPGHAALRGGEQLRPATSPAPSPWSAPRRASRRCTSPGPSAGAMAGYAVSQVGFINAGQPSLILVGSPGFNSRCRDRLPDPRAGRRALRHPVAHRAPSRPRSRASSSCSRPPARRPRRPPSSAPRSPAGSRRPASRPTATPRRTSSSGRRATTSTQSSDAQPGRRRHDRPGRPDHRPHPLDQPDHHHDRRGHAVRAVLDQRQHAGQPADLRLRHHHATSPSFTPVTDINPATVVVNGVAFPNATLTPDPNTADWVNGIQDAIITITPAILPEPHRRHHGPSRSAARRSPPRPCPTRHGPDRRPSR